MIQVTLTFYSMDAAVKALREIPEDSLKKPLDTYSLGAWTPEIEKACIEKLGEPKRETAAEMEASAKVESKAPDQPDFVNPGKPIDSAIPEKKWSAETVEKVVQQAKKDLAKPEKKEEPAEETPTAPALDYDRDIKVGVIKLAEKDKSMARALLDSFDVPHAKNLPVEKHAEFVKALNAKLKELGVK